MSNHIRKVGSTGGRSLYITIPADVVKDLDIKKNDLVMISTEDRLSFQVKKASVKPVNDHDEEFDID